MFAKLLDSAKECLCYPFEKILIPCGSGGDILAIATGIEIGMNKKLYDVSRYLHCVKSFGYI
jgi:hypothetical protein